MGENDSKDPSSAKGEGELLPEKLTRAELIGSNGKNYAVDGSKAKANALLDKNKEDHYETVSDDDFSQGESSTKPSSNKPAYERPPDTQPDGGMGTTREESITMEELSPELQDDGMSAGYPPLRDEDLLPEPVFPLVKPEPASMRDAPLFSTRAFEFPGSDSASDPRTSHVQDEEIIAKQEILATLVPEEKNESALGQGRQSPGTGK